jgi:hypothetical protein
MYQERLSGLTRLSQPPFGIDGVAMRCEGHGAAGEGLPGPRRRFDSGSFSGTVSGGHGSGSEPWKGSQYGADQGMPEPHDGSGSPKGRSLGGTGPLLQERSNNRVALKARRGKG